MPRCNQQLDEEQLIENEPKKDACFANIRGKGLEELAIFLTSLFSEDVCPPIVKKAQQPCDLSGLFMEPHPPTTTTVQEKNGTDDLSVTAFLSASPTWQNSLLEHIYLGRVSTCKQDEKRLPALQYQKIKIVTYLYGNCCSLRCVSDIYPSQVCACPVHQSWRIFCSSTHWGSSYILHILLAYINGA